MIGLKNYKNWAISDIFIIIKWKTNQKKIFKILKIISSFKQNTLRLMTPLTTLKVFLRIKEAKKYSLNSKLKFLKRIMNSFIRVRSPQRHWTHRTIILWFLETKVDLCQEHLLMPWKRDAKILQILFLETYKKIIHSKKFGLHSMNQVFAKMLQIIKKTILIY